MSRLSKLCVCLAVAISGVRIMRAQQQQAPNPNFTGTVTAVEANSQGTIAHFRFEPGSRTKWHSHEGGQIILVEEGVVRTQVKGVVHWHGASPDKGGTRFNVSRDGITWLEGVTDKEFAAAPKKR